MHGSPTLRNSGHSSRMFTARVRCKKDDICSLAHSTPPPSSQNVSFFPEAFIASLKSRVELELLSHLSKVGEVSCCLKKSLELGTALVGLKGY